MTVLGCGLIFQPVLASLPYVHKHAHIIVTQRRGFDPPLGTFSGRRDFSLGVNMGSNSIPPKTLSDESINRGLVCAHMHFIARTQKILTFMS